MCMSATVSVELVFTHNHINSTIFLEQLLEVCQKYLLVRRLDIKLKNVGFAHHHRVLVQRQLQPTAIIRAMALASFQTLEVMEEQ
jgi:hypothetical protein